MWQAEADAELTLSALPATAVQWANLRLTLANYRYGTVEGLRNTFHRFLFLPQMVKSKAVLLACMLIFNFLFHK